MRLSETQRKAITDTIHGADADAPVFLFGSRVDDHAKGGDIDLLVISSRIDLVIQPDLSRPFARLAFEEGVQL